MRPQEFVALVVVGIRQVEPAGPMYFTEKGRLTSIFKPKFEE